MKSNEFIGGSLQGAGAWDTETAGFIQVGKDYSFI